MWAHNTLIILLACLTAICQASLMQYASQIPPCGLTCIITEIPKSECKVATNDTCICSNTALADAVQVCVLGSCTTEEALSIQRTQDEACGRPYRSRRTALWAFISIEVFTLVCASLHITSRRASGRRYEIDDYIVFIVLLLWFPFTVLGAYARLTGFGVDMWTLRSDEITTALKLFFIDETFYLAILALCKIAILSFYLRIFPNKWFRIIVYVTIGFVSSSAMVLIFLQIFQCLPIDYNWEGWTGTYGSYKCLSVNTLTYTAASFSILQDVVVLALPLPLVVRLNANWRKKVGIIIMFSLGVFILITSCIRLRYLVMFARSQNPTWDYTDPLIWSALEVNVSIVVVSLPAIRALLALTLPKVFGSTVRSKSSEYNRTGASNKGTIRLLSSRNNHHHHHHVINKSGASKFSGVFSSSAARGTEDDAESQLELGDRVHGTMETEIAVDYGQTDDRSQGSTESQQGIHIRRTTVWTEETGKKAVA